MNPSGANSRPILLVGGSGQVGFELARQLSGIAKVASPGSGELNLLSPDDVRTYIAALRPALIINAAAHTAVDLCETEVDKATALNQDAPALLAEEARKLGVGLVHFSTDYVFDGTKKSPYVETDETNPLSVYGRTKLGGENGIRAAGAPSLIFRCEWVYSRRGKNFLLTMLRLGAERESLSIVSDQRGAPTWAREIAGATASIVSAAFASKSGVTDYMEKNSGTYHMAAAGSTTWFEFAEAIFQYSAGARPALIPITTDQYPTPAKRPANSVFDTTRLSRTFGISLPEWRAQLDQAMTTEP